MPDPCHAENLQGSQRRPEPAEIARDQRLLIKKMYFLDICAIFSKSIILKKGHNLEKRAQF